MTAAAATVGTRVRTLVPLIGVPKGSTGTIIRKEHYKLPEDDANPKTSVVKWDAFNFTYAFTVGELSQLEIVK